jgi:hypothetical protein
MTSKLCFVRRLLWGENENGPNHCILLKGRHGTRSRVLPNGNTTALIFAPNNPMNGPSTVSPVSEEQLTAWCSDWAAEGGLGILAKVHLQTLVSHLLDRKMSPGEIQRQLGLAAAGMEKMVRVGPPVDAGPPAVEVEQPAPAEISSDARPAAAAEGSPGAALENPEGTLPGFD